jgi:hypothetical protein
MVFRVGGEKTLYSSTVVSPAPQPLVTGFSTGYYLVTWSDGTTPYSVTTEVISPSGTVSSSQTNDNVVIDYSALSNGFGAEAYVQLFNGQYSVVYGTWGPPPSGAFLLTQIVLPTNDVLTGVGVSNGLNTAVSYYDTTNSTLYLELGSQSQGQAPIAVATSQSFGTQPSELISLSNGNYAIEWDTTAGPKLEILNSSGTLVNTPSLPTSNVDDVVGLAPAASGGSLGIAETVNGQVNFWLMDGTSFVLSQTLVSPVSETQDSHAQVATLSNGDFAVVWQNNATHQIEGRILDATGTPLGASFTINSLPNVSGGPSVAALGSNQFVVSWSDATGQGTQVESQTFTLNAGTWTKIDDNGSPIAISAGDFSHSGVAQLIASYATGTYAYSGAGWSKIDGGSPNLMATGDFTGSGQTQLVGVFPGYGTYTWTNASGWNKIDNGTPYVLTTGNYSGSGQTQLAGAFSGYGTYTWTSGIAWEKIDAGTPTLLVSGDFTGAGHSELGGVFAGYGTYTWTNTTGWIKIDAGVPDQLVSGTFYNDGKAELAGYFAGYGTYIWSQTAGWSKIDSRAAGGLASVDLNGDGKSELLAYFQNSGVFEWESGVGWSQYDATSALPTTAQKALFATSNFQGGSVIDAAVTFPGQSGIWLDPPDGTSVPSTDLLTQAISSSFAAPTSTSIAVSSSSTDQSAQVAQLTMPHAA